MDPFEDLNELSLLLKEKYDLLEACVVFSPKDDYPTITDYLSRFGADYLQNTVKDGDIVGVSWAPRCIKLLKRCNLNR